MPDFLVNSEGVSFAMSFIWGLSTMATLIEPRPDPPPPLSPPPQPANTSPANSAAMNVARTVPLMFPLFLEVAGDRSSSGAGLLIALVYVGCQGLRPNLQT